MIPKIIHYCWFGKNQLPDSFNICLESWKKYLPEYVIIKWDENNFEIENACEYVKKAAESKRWAFVSDYVRAYALEKFGGIYMDIDVEVKINLDEFLSNRAFSGFEIIGSPFTALWGAEKNHPWTQKVLDFYHKKQDFDLTTNTVFVSGLLINYYKVDPFKNETQYLKDGIVIYPSNYFCLDLPKNFATHHFIGTWHLKDTENPFKDLVSTHYLLNQVKELKNANEKIHNIINNNKLFDANDILNQFPLKVLLNNVLYRIRKKIL